MTVFKLRMSLLREAHRSIGDEQISSAAASFHADKRGRRRRGGRGRGFKPLLSRLLLLTTDLRGLITRRRLQFWKRAFLGGRQESDIVSGLSSEVSTFF